MQLSKKLKDNDFKIKSICKLSIYPEATGFFLKIQKKRNYFFLITCYHALSKYIKDKSDIEIRLNEEKKYIIELDDKKRLIKCLEDKDIAAIEIIDKDKLKNCVNFLDIDLNYTNGNEYNQYINKEIIILEYYNGRILYKKGEIIDIKDKEFEFKHNIKIKEESEGSPFVLFNNSKAIGIQKRYSYGSFIAELLKELD